MCQSEAPPGAGLVGDLTLRAMRRIPYLPSPLAGEGLGEKGRYLDKED